MEAATKPVVEASAVGLSQAEAARRLKKRRSRSSSAPSRSYGSILFANTFTIFNLILAGFGAATLIFGNPRDAVFLLILAANVAIGTVQEVRAKRTLDKLAAIVVAQATVVRDGEPREVPVGEIVVGDLIRVETGAQIAADGKLIRSDGLALDEAELTGESEPVLRDTGDEVLSGAFVVEGEGEFEATAVGADSHAAQLTKTARRFRHPRSPLERAMDRLLLILVGVMLPLGIALGVSLALNDVTQQRAVQTLTAGVTNIIPEGLILLVSLTAAVTAAKMARHGILAQQLNAVESLASVSVMCTDKTGTLTEAALRVVEVVPAEGVGEGELEDTFARYAASSPSRNATLEAIHNAALAEGVEPEEPTATVPFSSRRRWSALEIDGKRLVLGAPEVLLDREDDTDEEGKALRDHARAAAAEGRRVLALTTHADPLPEAGPEVELTSEPEALGIVILAEELRESAAETVAFFAREDVALKVLSGDNPATVGAIARDLGIEAEAEALDGTKLPEDDAELLEAVRAAPAIGRISPEDKARVVRVLAQGGEYVAMLGDGVNDVPALKEARLAIAQGSGTQMARSVADLVLVSGEFGEVPPMVDQGRQILRNIQRVARLFVSKAVAVAFLVLVIGIPSALFPMLPRQFTLTTTFTIGIPAFFLALAPSSGPWRPEGFLRELARFAIPAGIATGIGMLAGYLAARHLFDLPLVEARSVTAGVSVVAGLAVVFALENEPGRRRLIVGGLVAAMAALFVIACAIPACRRFFAIAAPNGDMIGAWAIGSVLSVALLVGALWITGRLTLSASRA
jgi:cation-transporting ATPase E